MTNQDIIIFSAIFLTIISYIWKLGIAGSPHSNDYVEMRNKTIIISYMFITASFMMILYCTIYSGNNIWALLFAVITWSGAIMHGLGNAIKEKQYQKTIQP